MWIGVTDVDETVDLRFNVFVSTEAEFSKHTECRQRWVLMGLDEIAVFQFLCSPAL